MTWTKEAQHYRPFVGLLLGMGLGCEGVIGEMGSSGEGAPGPGADPAGGTLAAGAAGSAGNVDDGPDPCLGAVFQSSTAPIRRLTRSEYSNTVQALFQGVSLPAVEVTPDGRQDGFSNSAFGQSASSLAVEQYAAAAESIATVAVANLGAWAPCSDDAEACVTQIARDLAFRTYRRPLDDDELSRVETFSRSAYADHGRDDAVQMVIEALLESPYFLYRPEFGAGETVGESAVALSGYEMASRLSYFFLATMPDDALFSAAEAGELSTTDGIEQHARRLIGDPRSRPVLTQFFVEWLRLYEIDELSLDPNRFPELDETLRRDLAESARLYIEHALWEQDSWTTLMTGTYGYVNDRLAPIFGVPAPGTDELVYTDLDPTERRGVLTQPGLLASTSHGIRHSPIFRGVTMLSNVLCQPPPAPPPGALDGDENVQVDPNSICTTRDEVALSHTSGDGCQSCHEAIDGAGFAFENYDALGRYRTEENGCAVDPTGIFPGTDIEGEVDGAIDLAERLVASETAMSCAGAHLFRFGLGRREEAEDACEIQALSRELGASDSLQGLILSLVITPSFRSKPSGS